MWSHSSRAQGPAALIAKVREFRTTSHRRLEHGGQALDEVQSEL